MVSDTGFRLIESGTSFGGYRVERLLGSGGMGVVYEAVQTSLDRRVALKILKPELARDPAFLDRFRREGRLQAVIEHPNVLSVYEVGEAEDHGLFIAMRLVDGPTLADLLKAGELDAGRTLRLLEQVGEAVDFAHEAGLVHRDVKPQNILVGENDVAFLADFGLSRIGTDPASRSRPTVGTVAYVAPEIIGGEAPGPASDRYAFAATLFHCLTGDVVFPRGSEAAVLFAHAGEPPPRISARRPELPASLDSIFEEALAKDPARRPAGARGLVASVRDRLEAAGVAELGPPQLGAPSSLSPETLPPSRTVPPRPERAALRPRVIALIALVAATAGAAISALLAGSGGDGSSSSDVAVPAVPKGAVALGSALEDPDRSAGCRGGEPREGAATCSIVQSAADGSQLVAPADGTITGWSVRGARGEVALDVIRPRGEDTVRVARSQWESAGNEAPFYFATSLPVERGDQIGIELGSGSSVGLRDVDGATTERWFDVFGGAYGTPDAGPGSGMDAELLLRADFVAGMKPEQPKSLTGRAAERAPDGELRKRIDAEISKPPAEVPVALVEVRGRVALDLFRGPRRIQRMFLPNLVPGGEPIALKSYAYDGNAFSEIDVFWVNPNSGRMFFHFLTLSKNQLAFEL